MDNKENSHFEDTIKSEDIRRNKNVSNEIQIEEGKSVISYEVETLDDNMNKNNSKETIEEEIINIKDQMNLVNYNETKKDNLIFIKEIEKKLRDDIYKIKGLHKQYIITACIKLENHKKIQFEIIYDKERDYFDYYPNNTNFNFENEDEPFNWDLDIPKEDFTLLIKNFKKYKNK